MPERAGSDSNVVVAAAWLKMLRFIRRKHSQCESANTRTRTLTGSYTHTHTHSSRRVASRLDSTPLGCGVAPQLCEKE